MFIDIVELGSTFTNHVPMEVMGTISVVIHNGVDNEAALRLDGL
jgi:hypothetical protein